jgi:hypothetical protein
MEYWNNRMLEYWNTGMMEYWNDLIVGSGKLEGC